MLRKGVLNRNHKHKVSHSTKNIAILDDADDNISTTTTTTTTRRTTAITTAITTINQIHPNPRIIVVNCCCDTHSNKRQTRAYFICRAGQRPARDFEVLDAPAANPPWPIFLFIFFLLLLQVCFESCVFVLCTVFCSPGYFPYYFSYCF